MIITANAIIVCIAYSYWVFRIKTQSEIDYATWDSRTATAADYTIKLYISE